MSLFLRFSLGAFFLSLVLLLPGCDPTAEPGLRVDGGEKNRIRFAILVDSLETPMRNHQVTLLDRLLDIRSGLDVTIYDGQGNPKLQTGQIAHALSQGATYLMVFPTEAVKLQQPLRDAVQQGAKVFAFTDQLPAESCTTAIFCPPRRLGEVAGDFVVAALKTKATDEGLPQVTGRVVQIRGDDSSPYANSIAEGFAAALSKEPGVVLVHDAPGYWSPTEATERAAEALRIQKNFDVIFAHNDIMALSISNALRAAQPEVRSNMLVLGLDGAFGKNAGMEFVRTEAFEASVYQPPLVDQAWKLVQEMLEDPAFQPQARYSVKPFVITTENVLSAAKHGLPEPVLE
jgi:ABC-type sugar transport system substrate-binding protein